MSKETLIAIGGYYDWDTAPMAADYDLHAIDGPDALATLPEAVRQTVRALAYKGHAAMTDTHMSALPMLGIIANYGVGYDAIDVGAAKARGIAVTNTPNVLNDDVADLAVAMAIAFDRRIPAAAEWVTSGNWGNSGEFDLNRKFSGRRVGILGLGRIGREIADRMAAFKHEIHYTSRSRKDTPPDWVFHDDPVALAAAVDTLVVALVGGPATEGAVSSPVLDALGPEGVLVNISRGSTVDEPALLDALETGGIRGAALDVFVGEPKIDPRFLALDNVLLQPHQGSGTVETRKAMGQLQRDNIAAFLADRPLLTPVT